MIQTDNHSSNPQTTLCSNGTYSIFFVHFFSNMIGQSVDAVNQYTVALRGQMAPLSADFVSRMTQEAEQLKARLAKDMTNVGENIQPQVQQMLEALQRQVEELKERATPYAESVDPEAVKAIVMEKTQELKTLLDRNVNNLQAQMVPITEQMKEKMELSLDDFQKKLVPLAQHFETEVNQKTQELQQSLGQRGQQLRTQLDASTQDLQAQLTALWETFTQRAQ